MPQPAARYPPWSPPNRFLTSRASGLANEIPPFEFDRLPAGVERYSDRIAAGFERIELFGQHPPHHQDAAVALAKMLLGMHGHLALTDLCLEVAGEALVLLLGHVPPEFSVEF